MYRGYPVGTLMFWETGAGVGTRQIGGGASDRVPQLLVVDGQQRLTSLYAVLTGEEILTKDFLRKRIRIAFNPTEERFEVTDAAIERDASSSRTSPPVAARLQVPDSRVLHPS
jgi:hypothetical protein